MSKDKYGIEHNPIQIKINTAIHIKMKLMNLCVEKASL